MKSAIIYNIATGEIVGMEQVADSGQIQTPATENKALVVPNDHEALFDQLEWEVLASGLNKKSPGRIKSEAEARDKIRNDRRQKTKQAGRVRVEYLLVQINELRLELGKPEVTKEEMEREAVRRLEIINNSGGE